MTGPTTLGTRGSLLPRYYLNLRYLPLRDGGLGKDDDVQQNSSPKGLVPEGKEKPARRAYLKIRAA
jgi:hypothetical protein